MADKIELVQGSNRPYIVITLRERDGSVMDIAGKDINVHFRAVGGQGVLAVLPCMNTGEPGRTRFNFPGSTLEVPPGEYEGEVRITHGPGDIETVYETLRFKVRAKF